MQGHEKHASDDKVRSINKSTTKQVTKQCGFLHWVSPNETSVNFDQKTAYLRNMKSPLNSPLRDNNGCATKGWLSDLTQPRLFFSYKLSSQATNSNDCAWDTCFQPLPSHHIWGVDRVSQSDVPLRLRKRQQAQTSVTLHWLSWKTDLQQREKWLLQVLHKTIFFQGGGLHGMSGHQAWRISRRVLH